MNKAEEYTQPIGLDVGTSRIVVARNAEGSYPDGSVNDRVQKKLQQFTEQQRRFAAENQRNSAS